MTPPPRNHSLHCWCDDCTADPDDLPQPRHEPSLGFVLRWTAFAFGLLFIILGLPS